MSATFCVGGESSNYGLLVARYGGRELLRAGLGGWGGRVHGEWRIVEAEAEAEYTFVEEVPAAAVLGAGAGFSHSSRPRPLPTPGLQPERAAAPRRA